jgi:riboflavin synthase
MFTGLVREVGTLRGMTTRSGVVRLEIGAPKLAARLAVGDSVAVDGICLTVTGLKQGVFTVDAATETRRLTTLKDWRGGRRLHLEPALRVGDPLDGHLVQGHVDGVGEVVGVRRTGGDLLVTIALAADLARFLTPKGSVAVDGVSLTVDEGPFTSRFTVNLIPYTLKDTCFAGIRSGRRVNLEMDVLVKAARSGSLANLPAVGDAGAPVHEPSTGWTLERLLSRGFGRTRNRGSR